MSKTFNYTRAWHELALPMWEALPAEMKHFCLKIAEAVGELRQKQDLNIPMPDILPFLVDHISDEVLAKASYACHYLGHWQPGITERVVTGEYRERVPRPVCPIPTEKGESWKVSNVLDQVLQGRFMSASGERARDHLREGQLIVCLSNKDYWMWEPIGWATKELKERVGVLRFSNRGDYYKQLSAFPPMRLTEPFMEHEKGTAYTDEEMAEALAAAGVTLLRGSRVEFDPHIPVIGDAAMEHANKNGLGIIGGDAPCSWREAGQRCNLTMDEHKKTTVLIVGSESERTTAERVLNEIDLKGPRRIEVQAAVPAEAAQ